MCSAFVLSSLHSDPKYIQLGAGNFPKVISLIEYTICEMWS